MLATLIGVAALAVLLIAWRGAPWQRGPRSTYPLTELRVIPFGIVQDGDLAQVLSVLREDFPRVPVRLGRPLPLPLAAFARDRRQFNVDVLLLDLQRQPGAPTARLIGVTGEDIYAAGAPYVFATTDARRDSVIAVARLHSSDPALRATRYRKILRRQLGFTFGFPSSRDRRCVMFYTPTLAALDAKGLAWCGEEPDAIRKIQGLP